MTYVKAFYDTLMFLVENEGFNVQLCSLQEFDPWTRNFAHPVVRTVMLQKSTKKYNIFVKIMHPYYVEEGEFPKMIVTGSIWPSWRHKKGNEKVEGFTKYLCLGDIYELSWIRKVFCEDKQPRIREHHTKYEYAKRYVDWTDNWSKERTKYTQSLEQQETKTEKEQ